MRWTTAKVGSSRKLNLPFTKGQLLVQEEPFFHGHFLFSVDQGRLLSLPDASYPQFHHQISIPVSSSRIPSSKVTGFYVQLTARLYYLGFRSFSLKFTNWDKLSTTRTHSFDSGRESVIVCLKKNILSFLPAVHPPATVALLNMVTHRNREKRATPKSLSLAFNKHFCGWLWWCLVHCWCNEFFRRNTEK